MNHTLQSMIKGPRKYSYDQRIAKTDETTQTVGVDGKLYKLLDPVDHLKFRVLSANEMTEEIKKTKEMEAALKLASGEFKGSTKFNMDKGKGVKLSAPKLGTSSKSKRNDKNTFEKASADTMNTKNLTSIHKQQEQKIVVTREASAASTTTAAIYNDNNNADDSSNILLKSIEKLPSETAKIVLDTINIIKSKYEMNANALDQLYNEKTGMEKKVKVLEQKLNRQRVGLSPRASSASGRTKKHSEEFLNKTTPGRINNFNTTDCSSVEPASLDHFQGNSSLPANIDVSDNLCSIKASATEPETSCVTPRRPSSAKLSHPANPRNSISEQLLNDQLNFKRKKELIKERDRLKAEEDRKWEEQQRERLVRATKVSADKYKALYDRQLAAVDEARRKVDEAKARMIDAERKDQEEHRMKRLEHIQRSSMEKTEMTWAELQETGQIRRHERSEKRKNEIRSSSAAPACALPIARKTQASKDTIDIGFKAEDPAVVSARLASFQRAHRQKEEADRIKIKDRGEHGLLKKIDPAVYAMEERDKAAAHKKAEREIKRKQKEDAEAAAALEIEQKRIERLFNTKIPDTGRRLTKSVECRAKIVRMQIEKEKEEQKRMDEEKKRKEKQSKEMTHSIKMVMEQSKQEKIDQLKAKGVYREISNTENKPTAEEAKRAFQAALKANKKRVMDSLDSRPSLIQRHDRGIAKKMAINNGLYKVASAIDTVNKGNDFSSNSNSDNVYSLEDDFLDEREKLTFRAVKQSIQQTS